MISKPNNNPAFRPVDGMNSEQESTHVKSEKAGLITEHGFPKFDSINSRKQDYDKDQWSTENAPKRNSSMINVVVSQAKADELADKSSSNIKIPSKIEFPNIVFEKKKL